MKNLTKENVYVVVNKDNYDVLMNAIEKTGDEIADVSVSGINNTYEGWNILLFDEENKWFVDNETHDKLEVTTEQFLQIINSSTVIPEIDFEPVWCWVWNRDGESKLKMLVSHKQNSFYMSYDLFIKIDNYKDAVPYIQWRYAEPILEKHKVSKRELLELKAIELGVSVEDIELID